MGGYGSSRWGGYVRKVCVEECLTLAVNILLAHATGSNLTCTWSRHEKKRASMEVVVHQEFVSLQYQINSLKGDPKSIGDIMSLCSHFTHRGRRYFGCPTCSRRCEKLYLPPGQFYFKCRLCHDLSYRTRQEHRKYQSLAKVLAESSPWSVKSWNSFLNSRW